MGARRCCCEWGCTVTEDDFTRGNSTNIGPLWTEDPDHATHGQWRLFNQMLQESGADAMTGTPGASIITVAEGNQIYMGVRAYRRNSGVGVKHRWLANVLDQDNYLFAEAEDIDANFVTIRLYKREGGVNTLLVEKTRTWFPDAENGFQPKPTLCLSPSSFTFAAAPGLPVWYCVDDPATFYFEQGLKAGLGNGGTEVVIFDGFEHDNFEETETPLFCCGQQCQCGEEPNRVCLPETLLLTIHAPPPSQGCNGLDQIEIELKIPPTGGVWEATATEPFDKFPFGVDWVFECAHPLCSEDFSDDEFMLRTTPTGENCPYVEDCLHFYEGAVSVSCDPFLVVFPIIYVPPTGLPGGCEHCDPTGQNPGWWWGEVTIP